jgi:hypothetical protein
VPTLQPIEFPAGVDMIVRGIFYPLGGMSLPLSSVGNASFNASDPLATAKMYHRVRRGGGQLHGTDATDERRYLYRAYAAGTLVSFRAGVLVAATGDDTVTVDLKKDGTTVLSAPISITTSPAAYASLAGTISVAAYAAGVCFDVTVDATHNAGTLPQGVWWEAVFDSEAP